MLKVFDQFQVFWGETEDHLCKSTYAFGMSDRVTVFSEVENGVVSALWLTLDIKEAGDREQAEKMLHVISEIAPLVGGLGMELRNIIERYRCALRIFG